MADKIQRSHSAKNVLNDKTLIEAFDEVQARIVKEMLVAKTPEERESKHQEWSGMNRIKNQLAVWSTEARRIKD